MSRRYASWAAVAAWLVLMACKDADGPSAPELPGPSSAGQATTSTGAGGASAGAAVSSGATSLAGAAGDGATAAGSPSGDQAGRGCEAKCAAAAQLMCEAEDATHCANECAAGRVAAQSMCPLEQALLDACMVTTTTSDYQCDEFGKTSLRSGVCAVEDDELFRCLGV